MSRREAALLLVLFCAGACAVRAYRFNETPSEFWTVRQYRGALLARAMYFEGNPDIPAWRKEVAEANRPLIRELPFLEWAAAHGYRAVGSEQFAIPRAITVAAWVVGGVFLFLLARRWMVEAGALSGAAYYLFLPFGIEASRSFQPDPLMVGGVLAGLLLIVRYFERSTTLRWWAAALVSSSAILIKPGASQFSLFAVYGVLAVTGQGWRTALLDRRNWLFPVVCVLPAAGFAFWSLRAGGDLQSHFSLNFLPHWLATLYFWKGWAGVLLRVLGLPALVLAVVGVLLLRGRGLAFVLAWGCGYVLQCFLTTYTTPSHDYWHLQVIPLAALGLARASEPFWLRVRRRWAFAPTWILLAFGLAWPLASPREAPWKRAPSGPTPDYVGLCKAIGEAVQHSTNTVFLDYDYGASLCYFAEVAGIPWPESKVMQESVLQGRADGVSNPALTAEERFKRHYAGRNPEYFIVCRAMPELDAQPGLRAFLIGRYPVVAQTGRYIVFDLKRTKP